MGQDKQTNSYNNNFDLWSEGQEKSLATRRGNDFRVTLTGNSETTLSLQTNKLLPFPI